MISWRPTVGEKSSIHSRQDRISRGLERKGHLRHVPVHCPSGGLAFGPGTATYCGRNPMKSWLRRLTMVYEN